MVTEKKSYGTALLIWLFFGGLGAHRVYIKESAVVVLWYWLAAICTLSIIVWVDLFRLKGMIQEQYEQEYIKEKAFKD
jgi:TM2 domain-containing membrane protein YozV